EGGDGPGCPEDTAESERPKAAPPRVLPVHATILRVRLVSLGDLVLDVVVAIDGPLVAGDDTPATTRVGAGGQGANVAAWAAALGAEARYVGERGADAPGGLPARELAPPAVHPTRPLPRLGAGPRPTGSA